MALFHSFRVPTQLPVARHEQVVFYPSYASRTEDGTAWRLVLQGRVFDPRISWLRRKPMLAVVKRVMRFDRTAEDYFRTRMRQFLMRGLRNRSVTIRLGDADYSVGESDYMGLLRNTICVSAEAMSRLEDPRVGGVIRWIPYHALFSANDLRACDGQLQLIEPVGMSIISDVDDTIKHSNVPNRRDLFQNTFARTFVPIAGMPELYRDCAAAGAAKKLRPSPQKAHKSAAIEPILDDFPQRRFVLIGDSGEQDAEIYSAFLRQRPQQIAGIFIRAIRGETRDAEKFRAAFAGLDPRRWTIYHQPAEIHDAVVQLFQSTP